MFFMLLYARFPTSFVLSYLHPKRVCCRQRSSPPEDSRWLALKRELKSEKREPETEPYFGPREFVTTRDPFLKGLSFCLRFSPEPFNFSGRKSRILILRINRERKRVKRERRRRIDKKTNFLLFRLDWNWNWIDFERTLHLGKTVWLFTASLSSLRTFKFKTHLQNTAISSFSPWIPQLTRFL